MHIAIGCVLAALVPCYNHMERWWSCIMVEVWEVLRDPLRC